MNRVENLVVRYFDWIERKARQYYSNRSDAEDLAGETIRKCLSNSEKFDNRFEFKPWAVSIMQNTYITDYNRRRKVFFSDIDERDEWYSPDRTDSRTAVNDILSLARGYRRERKCIRSMLLYAKGYSYDEIADIEDVPVGTVKSRVWKARNLLMQDLGVQ